MKGGRSERPSPQELQVVRAVATYGTMRAAADALGLSPHTVDAHLDHLRAKSGLRYLPQLVAWAAARGWLEPDSELGQSPHERQRQSAE